MRKADVLKLKKGDLVRVTPVTGLYDERATVCEVIATDVVERKTYGRPGFTVDGVNVFGCVPGEPGSGVAVRDVKSIHSFSTEWGDARDAICRFVPNRKIVSRWDEAAEAAFMANREAVQRAKEDQRRREAVEREARDAANRDAVAYLRDALPDGHTLRGMLVTHPEWRDRVDVRVVDLADLVRTITGE